MRYLLLAAVCAATGTLYVGDVVAGGSPRRGSPHPLPRPPATVARTRGAARARAVGSSSTAAGATTGTTKRAGRARPNVENGRARASGPASSSSSPGRTRAPLELGTTARTASSSASGDAFTGTSAAPTDGRRTRATATTAGYRWIPTFNSRTGASSCGDGATRTVGRPSCKCSSPSARTTPAEGSGRGRTRGVCAACRASS